MSAPLAFESQSTWYEAQAERQPAGEPLSGLAETDVCIVGAGLAGLFLAKELTEHHRSALILEARRIGAGASGLYAAYCLVTRGLTENIIVLEAEDRVGGRIHSIPFNGHWLELGATWIHGRGENLLWKLVYC